MANKAAVLKPTLSVVDASAIIIGMVIGAGIFETPALVISNAGSASIALLAWVLGGAMSLLGALCYAELATAYPHPGGDYYYFNRAFGKDIAFLFAWARLAVIQTGSIALFAFVFGDYASQILPLGNYASSIYAAFCIVILTALNLIGVHQGKWAQNVLTLTTIVGLVSVIFVGLAFAANSAPAATAEAPATQGAFGLAMVFVLLTYGGWNEAAYISAELRQVHRNMVKALIWSIGIITSIYLLVNLAYIQGLGISGLADSNAVAADLMRRAVGEGGAIFISFLVAVTALSSINATIITGARTNYALGRDFRLLAFLGHWSDRANTPTNSLLVQGAIALALVLLGTLTRNGFETMVDYTAPVFWFFFLLSGVSLFVLRRREPEVPRPFRVPAYPLIPLLFCAICGYLLYSSLAYTGIGALVGVAVLVVGVPLLLITRRLQS
jgi:amino acid transporter